MPRRQRKVIATGGLAAALAAAGVAASPAAGAASNATLPAAKPAAATCSTDIVGRGPGSNVDRVLEFSYTLAGASCKNALYTLIVRNNYDPRQVAVFAKLGDGKSKDVFFNEKLPWTPTGNPATSDPNAPDGSGLCVVGVTLKGLLHVDDVAPDPADGPCEPLHGGTARAFH